MDCICQLYLLQILNSNMPRLSYLARTGAFRCSRFIFVHISFSYSTKPYLSFADEATSLRRVAFFLSSNFPKPVSSRRDVPTRPRNSFLLKYPPRPYLYFPGLHIICHPSRRRNYGNSWFLAVKIVFSRPAYNIALRIPHRAVSPAGLVA